MAALRKELQGLKLENAQLRNNGNTAASTSVSMIDKPDEENDVDEIVEPSGKLQQIEKKCDVLVCHSNNADTQYKTLEQALLRKDPNLRVLSLSCPIWRRRTFDHQAAEEQVAR